MASKLSELISATTEKTTPVDSDKFPLLDSTATNYFKWIGWGSLKTALASIFPLLSGKSGGQTLIGGTAVTDKLVLQGTSGNGTGTATALEVKAGNAGSLIALTVSNNGQLTIKGDATTDLPTYGAELLSSAGWTVNAGWTESPDDVFAHSSGTATLYHSATITNGAKYQIAWTITGRTTGSVTISIGGQSISGQSATGTFGPTASSTAAFTITPTTDFNGTISLVSLKQITGVSTPNRVVKNSNGTVLIEERGNSSSLSIGIEAGRYNTTGSNNSFFGSNSGRSNTTGSYNSFVGGNAGNYNTTGNNNSFVGYGAGYSNTTGGNNSFIGGSAGYSNTTGGSNIFVGMNSGYFNTTGGNNSFIGYGAGRYQSDGATALTDPEYSIYIGVLSKGKDNSDSNSIVIGYSAIGLGANTTVIGNSSTTLTRLYGNIGAGVDSPSAAIHTIKTTEQLRLGYDASNYASFTVASDGTLNLTTSNNKIALGASRTPASASATGSAGEICWDSSYIYVCTAANTWKRAALTTW